MPTSQQLREQRANLWSQMTENMDRQDRTAQDDETYDRLEKEYDALDEKIERAERHERRESQNRQVDRTGVVPPAGDDAGPNDDAYASVFRTFLRNGLSDLAPEHRALMRSRFQAPQAAAGVGTGSAGGYAVPLDFRNTFVETLKYYGPMLELAEVIETASGVNLPWPTNDDTANVGAILAENTQVTEQDVTLGTASLDAYMYTSKLVRVSFQLLQDRPDFDTWLARKLGERVGRILNQHFTTGTGTAQPDGIVTSATVGVTGTGSFATTGGVSGDNLIDLTESLDPAYGNGQGLRFMGHQTVRKAVRKLKDSTGQYLWQPSLQTGVPATLAGYEFTVNNDMPTLAQNSKSLLFGNVREAYVARIVQDLRTMRLEERYADFLQVGFLAFERADGTLQNGNAVRVFQTTNTA